MKHTPAFHKLRFCIILLITSLIFSCTKTEYFSERPGYQGPRPDYDGPFRAEVPIKISYFSSKDTRASITMTINGAPVDVLFDTGSWGLRVYAEAVNGLQIDTTNEKDSTGYTGGVGFAGKVAGAYLGVGRLQNPSPTRFMRIDYTNRDKGPFTPVGDSPNPNNGLTNGFNGIVGVGLRYGLKQHGIANPLTQMPGNGAFIIHFPGFKDGRNGVLILNPSEKDRKGFSFVHLKPDSVLLPNGFNSWLEDQLQGTVTVNGVPFTNNTLLDSGNPFDFFNNGSGKADTLDAGNVVKLSLLNPPIQTTFTVKNQASGQDLVAVNNARVRNVFGIQFFFEFDVLYDQQNGLIGIRKRLN
jgi:hypothetical protein